MKTIYRLIIDCNNFLPKVFKLKAILIFLLIFISILVDLLGVATVFPLFGFFLSGDMLQNEYVRWLYQFIGVESEQKFFLILVGVVSLILISKTLFITLSSYMQGKFIYSIYGYYVQRKYVSIYKLKDNDGDTLNSDDVKSDMYLLPRIFANQLLISLLNIVAEAFVLLIVFTFLVLYSWKIVLLFILTIMPFFFVFYLLVRKRISTLDETIMGFLSKIAKSVSIAHFGKMDIRLSNSFNFFYNRLKNIITNESRLLAIKFTLTKIPASVVELSVLFSLIIMVLYSFLLNVPSEELLIQLSVFGIASLKLMPSFNRMMYAVINIKANYFSLDIIKEPEDQSNLVAEKPMVFNQKLDLSNIEFSYKSGIPILNQLNITVNKGERIGIIGVSGSGKSTLLKMLLGQITADRGEILVDDVKITPSNLVEWHQIIGFVSQDVFILDDTIGANIALGQEEYNEIQLQRAIKDAALQDFIDNLPDGLDTNLGEMGGLVSGGQKQRIGIARALYKGAKILLLDEATSSLDEKTEEIITKSIIGLPKDLTIITISHKHSFLGFCDRILTFKNGSLSEVEVKKE